MIAGRIGDERSTLRDTASSYYAAIKRTALPLLLAILFVPLASTVLAQTPLVFKATVHAGESYIHPIGHGLYFALDQVDGGDWNFQIRPAEESTQSYITCLSSPFWHGPMTEDLVAWRFAPRADVGWAERVPVQKRFSFVTNAADQRYECAEQHAVYESFQRSQSQGVEENYSGLPHYRSRPQGRGKVVVESATLKPGSDRKDAEFGEITLRVSIRFPTRRDHTSTRSSRKRKGRVS